MIPISSIAISKEIPTHHQGKDGQPREAKWWYSTFHIVTAMVGAGVLSLPYAMAHLGWGLGILFMFLSSIITLYTLRELVQLHECVPGVRFDRYYSLGQYAFGPKLGAWIVLPQQLIVQIGCDIVYMVTGGKCLKNFMEIACSTNCTKLRQSYWICIFGSIHFVLSQLPDMNSVAGVSVAAAIMSLSYSTIAWVGSIKQDRAENVSYAYKYNEADSVFRMFGALGQIAFAYAGHAVTLEIQATLPSTPEKPSKIFMFKGAYGAYFITAICYLPVAFIGYWAFGKDVADNVLENLERPSWLVAAANLMVFIHVIGSYQVFAMPVFNLAERTTGKMFKVPEGILHRLVVRSTYVAFTLFLGVTFPFFGDLLGFFGGFGFAPSSYILPCLIWLVIKKPSTFSVSWLLNSACILVGVFIVVASTIGGFRNIINDSSSYSFYS